MAACVRVHGLGSALSLRRALYLINLGWDDVVGNKVRVWGKARVITVDWDDARTPIKLVEEEVTMGLAQHSQLSTAEDTGKPSKISGCEGVF